MEVVAPRTSNIDHNPPADNAVITLETGSPQRDAGGILKINNCVSSSVV
jgi:hypothetical protein